MACTFQRKMVIYITHRMIYTRLVLLPNVMLLDPVGLTLGILGLWGLPTLWRRVLYVGGELNASSQSSQDFSRPVKFHGNEPKSTHALPACWIAYTTGHRGTSEVLMGLRRKLRTLRGS